MFKITHPQEQTVKLEIMYVIVEIAGQQFKVEKDQKIFVHRLSAEEGGQVEFPKVLLVDNDGEIVVGAPTVEGAKVTAKVLSHMRGDKVKVFKKKRRKGYRKLNGHRQDLSQIQIEEIVA
ncbi:50S ribosomal protein L21 [Labilibaculum euxinus]